MARRSRRKSRRLFTGIVALVLGAIGYWIQQQEGRTDRGGGIGDLAGGRESGADPGRSGGRGGFEEVLGCRLSDQRSNDGDSFELRAPDGRAIVLRLYFVDCPEKYRHQYNGKRIADQGRYFGGLDEDETIAVGQRAKELALGLLRRNTFSVWTRWEPVFDSERVYGLVEFKGGVYSGRYLSEVLTETGLARIHTKGVDLPDGRSRQAFTDRLRTLEKEAKREGRGGWGM